MKRRTFVLLSLYTGAAAGIPFAGCTSESTVAGKAWVQPSLLSQVCDLKTLQEIGTTYREKVKAESSEKKLLDLLLSNGSSDVLPVSSADAVISSWLRQKITMDFINGKTVIVKGWVLAETEARQCALFSLTQQ